MKRLGLLGTTLLAVLCVGPGRLAAQESRATLTGRVVDASGAAVPDVAVTVSNPATGAVTKLTTGASGQYHALYLLPGTYTVSAERAGFRTAVHEKVALRVGDKVELDFKLNPSAVVEEIEVVAQRPLLDTGTGTLGQLIDSTLITQLPLGDGTAYSLARLVPGTTFEGGYALQRPMDNGNLFGERVGGVGRSEFTLDGSSNVVNVSGTPAMGISPPAEAIQEFKFETAAYDAQVGHTGAGAVNLALKSGANAFHVAAYYFNRDDSRSANDFASNKAGLDKAPRNYYRFGATVSGPVFKNKTFFVVSYEQLADIRTEPFTYTVPTERMRNGDFSELLPSVVIYDPASARLVNGVVVRDPFPGNVIPANRLNQVARNVLSYYPLPNQPGAADRSQNYFVQQPWDYTYDYEMIKLDHQWSPDNHSYLRFTRNWRDEERGDFAGVQNGVEISRGIDSRYNYNLALGHTTVFSPTMVLDVKASALRFTSWQRPAAELDPASLGFSPQTVSLMDGYSYIPRFNINGYVTMGSSTTAFGAPREVPFYNYSVNPTLTSIRGSHTVRLGYDFRMLREDRVDEAYKGGQYTFDGAWARASSTSATLLGQQMAQFLLGLPTNGTMDLAASRADEVVAHGIFIQDDWRVSPRLTLNLGLRYDYEQPMTERHDRNTRAFDLLTANPIQAQATLNYARNPIPQLPVSQFDVLGGYTFVSADQREIWKSDLDNVQPRLGFSFKATEKTVVRGGVGLFVPLFEISGLSAFAINQTGFSRSTSMNVTQNTGLTFNTDLTNPFPGGLLQPVGSSQGLQTNLGNNVGTFVPLDRENPQYWRFSLGLQRELLKDLVAELSYVGQRGQNLVVTDGNAANINYIPLEFRSSSRTRDNALETLLGQQVPNPFQGLLPDAPGVNGATIARGRLLTPYPQFGTLQQERYDGSSRYDAFLIRLEKRFSSGSFLTTNYTYSRFREKISSLNAGTDFEDRLSLIDRPHRFVFAGVLQLPFGRGRKVGSDWSGVTDAFLGGWQLTTNYQFQTGEPLGWGNVYWDSSCGDPSQLETHWGHDANNKKYGIDVPAFDTSCFYFHDAAVQTGGVDDPAKQRNDQRIALTGNNVRYFPSSLPDFRGANHHSFDVGLGKTFRVGKDARLEIRAEVLNALNYTIFRNSTLDLNPRNATFGTFTGSGQPTVVMLPRDIQLGARLTF